MGTISMADEFTMSHLCKAPRQKVWDAWTRPEILAQWFGPKGSKMTIISADIRPGGVVHSHMDFPGGPRIWAKFVYREVTAPSRLVWEHSFSDEHANITESPFGGPWPKVLLNTVIFEDEGTDTRIRLISKPLDATPAEKAEFRGAIDSMSGGWGGSFEVLDELLAG
jgi:uncharacterized protein YndB with AHSA1/START domain